MYVEGLTLLKIEIKTNALTVRVGAHACMHETKVNLLLSGTYEEATRVEEKNGVV